MKTCKGTKRDGKPCGMRPAGDDELCRLHKGAAAGTPPPTEKPADPPAPPAPRPAAKGPKKSAPVIGARKPKPAAAPPAKESLAAVIAGGVLAGLAVVGLAAWALSGAISSPSSASNVTPIRAAR